MPLAFGVTDPSLTADILTGASAGVEPTVGSSHRMTSSGEDPGYGGAMDPRPTGWERVRRVDPRVWDGLLFAALLTISLLSLRHASPQDGRRPDVWASVLTVATVVPLWWWRRRPLEVLAVVSVAATVYGIAGYPMSPIVPLALASYAAASRRPRSSAQTAAFAAALVASVAIQYGAHLNWVEVVIGSTFDIAIPAGIGRIMWNRRLRQEREREVAAREAVAAERARIARELHDVVAHSMSVMVVQAGAARAVLRQRPEEAEHALRTIEDAGRTGLAEMRRLLDSDGPGADVAPLAPQPGLADMDELVVRMRATGLPVEIVTEGAARPLSPGVDLSAYRIVQEALTNTLKHAGRGAHARVVIRYTGDALDLEVGDDGRGPVADGPPGHGLIGMRERVAMFGGTLTTGPRPGGGFEVRAIIPAGDEP
jgi:signal transduction histidine kinase